MFQHEFNKLFKLIVPADVGWITGDDIHDINPEILKKYKLIVVDYSCEHYGNHPAPMPAYHDLVKMGVNFIFLTHQYVRLQTILQFLIYHRFMLRIVLKLISIIYVFFNTLFL